MNSVKLVRETFVYFWALLVVVSASWSIFQDLTENLRSGDQDKFESPSMFQDIYEIFKIIWNFSVWQFLIPKSASGCDYSQSKIQSLSKPKSIQLYVKTCRISLVLPAHNSAASSPNFVPETNEKTDKFFTLTHRPFVQLRIQFEWWNLRFPRNKISLLKIMPGSHEDSHIVAIPLSTTVDESNSFICPSLSHSLARLATFQECIIWNF